MKLSTGKTTIPGFLVTSSPPFKNALTEEFYDDLPLFVACNMAAMLYSYHVLGLVACHQCYFIRLFGSFIN